MLTKEQLERVSDVQQDISTEIGRARASFGSFRSAHEAYAILLEEVEELWAEIKVKQGKRDMARLYTGAVQVAAMATLLASEVTDD